MTGRSKFEMKFPPLTDSAYDWFCAKVPEDRREYVLTQAHHVTEQRCFNRCCGAQEVWLEGSMALYESLPTITERMVASLLRAAASGHSLGVSTCTRHQWNLWGKDLKALGYTEPNNWALNTNSYAEIAAITFAIPAEWKRDEDDEDDWGDAEDDDNDY